MHPASSAPISRSDARSEIGRSSELLSLYGIERVRSEVSFKDLVPNSPPRSGGSPSRLWTFSCWLIPSCLRTRSVEEGRDSSTHPNIFGQSGSFQHNPHNGPFGNQKNPLPRDPSVEVELVVTREAVSGNGEREPDRLVSLNVAAPSVFNISQGQELKEETDISSRPSMRTERSIKTPKNQNSSRTLGNRGAGIRNIESLNVQRLVKSNPVIEV